MAFFFPLNGHSLVVFLTGTGGTANWADRKETGWSKLAVREGFALAIPEALPPDPCRTALDFSRIPRMQQGRFKLG